MPKADWTLFIYLAAHNNLGRLGKRSLDQILAAGSTPHVKLAALYEHAGGATRYLAGAPGLPAVEEPLSNFDPDEPDTLLNTAAWAFEQCPAERYGLVLWSHGSGWRPEEVSRVAQQVRGSQAVSAVEAAGRAELGGGTLLFRATLARLLNYASFGERAACFDDGSGHCLDVLELARLAGELQTVLGQPLDLLGLDAGGMASLEAAYEVRASVRYLVASEELAPASCWPYDTLLATLRATREMPARELAKLIVQRYHAFYTAHPPQAGDVTHVALDLARVDELARAVDGLAGALLADMPAQAGGLWKTQTATLAREIQTPQGQRRTSKFDYHLWDLGTLAAHLAAHCDQPALCEAARAVGAALRPPGAVMAEAHLGEWFDGLGGVSIYTVPPTADRLSPYYSELALARDTRWSAMQTAYHQALA
jgi:hypothetical protein